MRTFLWCGAFAAAGCLPAMAGDPTGDWQVEGGVANIRVAECNGSLWGVVSWEKIPGGTDKNNPDVSKRNRPTLGMATLLDFKKKPNAEEWTGKAYDAQTTGRLYDTTLKTVGDNKLEINGCFLFICSGQTWTRASPPIPSSPSNQKGLPKASQAKMTPPAPAAPQAPAKSAAPKPGQPVDTVGDICLLPEIARAPH